MEYRHDDKPGPSTSSTSNQTAALLSAPHLYFSTAARFMINRQVLTTQQAERSR